MEGFREGFQPQAEHQVRVSLTLDAIAKAENIEIGSDAVEEEYKKMAEGYGIEVEKIKGFVSEESIVSNLRLNKAIDLIKETAVLTDAPKEEKAEEAAPKKKAPAKKKASKAKKAEAAEEPKEGAEEASKEAAE